MPFRLPPVRDCEEVRSLLSHLYARGEGKEVVVFGSPAAYTADVIKAIKNGANTVWRHGAPGGRPTIPDSCEEKLFKTCDQLDRDSLAQLQAHFEEVKDWNAFHSIFRLDVFGNVISRFAAKGAQVATAIDHWIPVAQGGSTLFENLRIIHAVANSQKGTALPIH